MTRDHLVITICFLLWSAFVFPNPLPSVPDSQFSFNETSRFQSYEVVVGQAWDSFTSMYPNAVMYWIHVRSEVDEFMTGPRDANQYEIHLYDRRAQQAYRMTKARSAAHWQGPIRMETPPSWTRIRGFPWISFTVKFRDAYAGIERAGYGNQWRSVGFFVNRSRAGAAGRLEPMYAFTRDMSTSSRNGIFVGAFSGRIHIPIPSHPELSNATDFAAQGLQEDLSALTS